MGLDYRCWILLMTKVSPSEQSFACCRCLRDPGRSEKFYYRSELAEGGGLHVVRALCLTTLLTVEDREVQILFFSPADFFISYVL